MRYPHVYKRKDRADARLPWVCEWYEAGKRRRKSFRTKADAEGHATIVYERYVNGESTVLRKDHEAKLTFKEYSRMWLEGLTDLRPATRGAYHRWNRKLNLHLGDDRIGDIEPDQIQAMLIEWDRSGVSAAYRRVLFDQANRVFKYAVADRVIRYNPCDNPNVRPPKVNRKVIKRDMYSDAELEFLFGLFDPGVGYMILFAAYHGLRTSEALALQKDVSFSRGATKGQAAWYLSIDRQVQRGGFAPPKGGTGKPPIPASLWARFEGHHKAMDDFAFLVPSPRNPAQPYSPNRFRGLWERTLRGTPLEGRVFHELRHTTPRLLRDAGFNLYQAAAWMRHSSTYMTEHYSHLWPDEIDRLSKDW